MANERELVSVLDAKQESEASVVQALLESEGIESIITSMDAPQDVLPGVGGVSLQVHASEADRARAIIEDYRSNADSEDGELASEEPQA